MSSRAISILVHADSKVGKTSLAATSPKPMLLLDAESAHRFIDAPKVFWDPMTQAPPEYDGTWEICVVMIRTYGHMMRVYEWLNSGQHPFVSVAIDSITEVQVKCKDDLTEADGTMKIQQWGSLLTHMEKLIRGFRDLTEHPTKPLQSVVVTSMTEHRDNKWRPYVQGKLQVKIPYFFDVILYMFVQDVPNEDPTQPATKIRRGLTVGDTQIEAGERVQGRLPVIIDNPRVDTMLDMVFPQTTVTLVEQPAQPIEGGTAA